MASVQGTRRAVIWYGSNILYTVKASKKGYYEKEAQLRLRREGETLVIDMDPSSPPPSPKVTQAPEGMVFVKGGCFQMGDQFGDGGDANEKPVHEVCVGDFYMGRYEVTVGEFRQFVSSSGYKTDHIKNLRLCLFWSASTASLLWKKSFFLILYSLKDLKD